MGLWSLESSKKSLPNMANSIEIQAVKSFSIDLGKVRRWADEGLKARGKTDVILEVEIVGAKRIRTLNKKFRNIDKSTDVLSFPLPKNQQVPGQTILGTIFLYSGIINTNAIRLQKSFESEFEFILHHGIDHLCGIHHK